MLALNCCVFTTSTCSAKY